MGYLEKIRSKLGNDPIILNSAGVLILDREGKVLLQYRKDTKNWGLPGGYMELGETFEDTAKREIKEEMGVELTHLDFFEIFSGSDFYHEYPNGDKVYSVAAIYIVNDLKEEMTPDDKEISRINYFSINELPHNITKTSKTILNRYIDSNNIQNVNH
ncbi:NUDIX hydrolase [Bacillus sp. V3B]|uniref:NUDIX hydrolase n=1 Tax=Bacillus sp. V3B TaxID=2804915 RepID=UPI00210E64F4|nr:NUDIX hydrolase [Bacillus sp. V3B]MCQ6277273.1 NUDIX hydrolase [Bacillus sp. V3B]